MEIKEIDKNRKLKVAFLGGGINSAVGYVHFSSINIDNKFELAAGYFSRHSDINIETAEVYKVSKDRVYDNIDGLIQKEKNKIDAVIILTPSDQHPKQVIKFINNDIPVICEKALIGSSEEALEIKDIINRKNGFLVVTYNYLGYPMIRELKEIISNGTLGKIHHIQIEMPQEGFARITKEGNPVIPQDWRLKDNNVPTISLDLGVHLHMFIKYLTNETPVQAIAKNDSFGNFSSIVDNVSCIVEYTNNITCNMWYSKIALGNRNGLKIRIYGDKGGAEWVQEFPEQLTLADNKANRWIIDRGNGEIEIANKQRYTRFKVGHPAGYIEAFANYYQDIFNALIEYKTKKIKTFTDCFGIDEAFEGIKLLEAINKSANSKSWITIEEIEEYHGGIKNTFIGY
ncbi:MAG: Gfo/Idh/MocA family oxidoreductase [Ignavibacteria bacterium]|jgi:predicted dehydrogenase